jgi:hypothetical protein
MMLRRMVWEISDRRRGLWQRRGGRVLFGPFGRRRGHEHSPAKHGRRSHNGWTFGSFLFVRLNNLVGFAAGQLFLGRFLFVLAVGVAFKIGVEMCQIVFAFTHFS